MSHENAKQLLGSIRDSTHRTVTIRPLEYKTERLGTMVELQQFVENHNVSIRGWDFPLISPHEGEQGVERDYFWSTTDFGEHREYWRLYKSGQFVAVLAEKAMTNAYQSNISFKAEGARFSISTVDLIYSMAEYFEFAHRLSFAGDFLEGVHISIEYKDMHNTGLGSEINRMISPVYVCQDVEWTDATDVSYEKILSEHKSIAREFADKFFRRFNLTLRSDILKEIQDSFFALRIGKDARRKPLTDPEDSE